MLCMVKTLCMEWNRDDKLLIEKNTVKEMRRGKNFKNYKAAARRSFKKAIANSNASVSAQANPPEGLKNCHSTECLVCGKCDHSPTASWRVPSLPLASPLASPLELFSIKAGDYALHGSLHDSWLSEADHRTCIPQCSRLECMQMWEIL